MSKFMNVVAVSVAVAGVDAGRLRGSATSLPVQADASVFMQQLPKLTHQNAITPVPMTEEKKQELLYNPNGSKKPLEEIKQGTSDALADAFNGGAPQEAFFDEADLENALNNMYIGGFGLGAPPMDPNQQQQDSEDEAEGQEGQPQDYGPY